MYFLRFPLLYTTWQSTPTISGCVVLVCWGLLPPKTARTFRAVRLSALVFYRAIPPTLPPLPLGLVKL